DYYVVTGEKKWATSGAIAGLFTVMAREVRPDGKGKISALVMHPDLPGVEIYQKNRSKCGIRGTWQARIRFHGVRVHKSHLLGQEGRGLQIALSCLNYGRCTLSAGMVGGARTAKDQATKWAATRFQFGKPLNDKELVRASIARMAAYTYAMDALLYMTTGMLDRHDEDIQVETAVCKVFCSEFGYRTVNDAIQIMGGESYMTENHVERMWRDSRINIIVEGANEVMHSFIFAYGSKQLGEYLLQVKANPFKHVGTAMQVGAELFLGFRRGAPRSTQAHPRIRHLVDDLMVRIQEHSHHVKLMFKEHEERLIANQMIQSRLSMSALWIHAVTCALSRCDANLRAGLEGAAAERELAIVEHLCAMARSEQAAELRALFINNDASMKKAAAAAFAASDLLPNSGYSIPEKTPDQKYFGNGRDIPSQQSQIPQFGSGSVYKGDMAALKSH
ncbi:MAG: acyl-CoA dehydrogenase family protein, partial [bacterium]